MSRAFALPLGVVPLVLGFALTGCGGSKSPSVASVETTTGSSSADTGNSKPSPSTATLVTCLRSHGLQAVLGPAGSANGPTLSLGGVSIPGANPASPQFQSALNACRKYLPGGGPPKLTPAQQAERAKAMARFAACMRTHGVPNFPDPNSSGFFPPGSILKINPGSPLVDRAFHSCQSLEANVGPRIALP